MNKYGILSITCNNNKFNRHWVSLPGGGVRLFDSVEEADAFAEGMESCARDNGIVDVGYRARKYNATANVYVSQPFEVNQ